MARALAIVIGDDRTDEDAFPVLADAVTIHVGPDNSTSARYCVRDQGDVVSFLSSILESWKQRLDSADSLSKSGINQPALALKETSPILNVRLRGQPSIADGKHPDERSTLKWIHNNGENNRTMFSASSRSQPGLGNSRRQSSWSRVAQAETSPLARGCRGKGRPRSSGRGCDCPCSPSR